MVDTPQRDDCRESADEYHPTRGGSGESVGDHPEPTDTDAASTGAGHRDAGRGVSVAFETFTAAVRRQLVLADATEATHVARAVLTTLAERVDDDTARAVAAPLPAEIQLSFVRADSGQAFDYETFLCRVATRTDTTPETAEYHAMVVLEQVADVAPHSTLVRLADTLPAAYDDLFTMVDAAREEA